MPNNAESLNHCELMIRPLQSARPALFLDRDGVIIRDMHHISQPHLVQVYPGARNLINTAHDRGWPIVVITNQSGIARGFFSWNDVVSVNRCMQEQLGSHAPLAAIYASGHGPDAPMSSWRKPSPQMLLEAAEALNLDLNHSIMVGDRLSDLQAGASAGVSGLFHVMTGHGREEQDAVRQWHAQRSPHGPFLKALNSLDTFPINLLKDCNNLDGAK